MTISTTTSRTSYNGNGVTTLFSVPFRFFQNSDLVVQLVTNSTGASTTLVLTTHYTVSGADSEAGGSLMMLTPPAVGQTLVIRRVIAATQEVDYVAGDPFPAETHERALDRLTMLSQQGEEVNSRSLTLPAGDTTSGEIPQLFIRANKLLAFDSSGRPTVVNPSTDSATDVRMDLASTASGDGAGMVGFKQSGAGAVDRLVQDELRERVSVTQFGAVGDGVTDDTAAIQAALDAANDVYCPPGVYNFTTLTVRQNTRLCGASSRTSVLKHTGSGVAITCTHSGTTEPDGNVAYIESGWFTFQDFTLLVNGTIGFNVGKTRSSFTNWEHVYIRHRQDSGGFFAGSTAINCDNSPWLSSYATYLSKLDNVFIRGFENGVNLNATVNAWQLNRVYMIEVKNQIVLSAATGISVDACYFESGIAAARGIVFGAGGGNTVGVTDSSFELTNVAGTQYAYDFSAGGTWAQINVTGCKYLLQGDGNGVNNRRIIGTAPAGFLELGRSYTNTTLSKDLPMLWAPGAAANHPVQIPNFSRLGGIPGGNGRLILGRGGSDASDGYIQNDGVYGLDFVAPSTGAVVDFDWMGNDGTLHLRYQGYAGGTGAGFYATTDNATTLGNSGRRWSQTYSREFRPGTGVPIWTSGAGTPEGVISAVVGSLYTRTDGGAATTLYVKETGTGNTGWVAK